MPNIQIREIRSADNPVLASIIRNVFEEYNAPKNGTVYSDPTTDQLFELFATNNAKLFVVENENGAVGCCGIFPTEGLPENCVEIVKFYILASARGRGFGKQLYQKCEQEAIDQGYKQLYIESTPEFKEAISFYEKLGFKQLNKPLGDTGHFGCNLWFLKTL